MNQETDERPASPQPHTGLRVARKKKWYIVVPVALALGLGMVTLAGLAWYKIQLQPVNSSSKQQVRLKVEQGETPQMITEKLSKNGLIRSELSFEWYVKLSDSSQSLKAGLYTLSPSMSVPVLVENLSRGQSDTFTLTLFPGATLRDTTDTPPKNKLDVKSVLLRAGYDETAVEKALNKTYDHPVLASKPDSADIEGYVYGETYQFDSTATPEDVIVRSFDELYKTVQENELEAAYKKRGLSLYEGITLASIIQREVAVPQDQKQIAGVFYNRIKQGIMLGSDVTYQYIADKTGVDRDPRLDSPYNTRRFEGLPPGPIAAPGNSALLATANPTPSDFIFFLSGDDDKTYFGKTQAEHEANIRNHCQEKCKIL